MPDDLPTAAQLLDQWSAEPRSVTIPKAVVIDRLLDLRNATTPNETPTVDRALAHAPGATIVPGDWWRAQLDELRLALTVDALAAALPPTMEEEPDAPLTKTAGPVDDRDRRGRFRRRSRPANDHDGDQRV